MFGFTDRDQESSAFYGYISENLSAFEATIFHEKYHYGFVKRCKRSKEKIRVLLARASFFPLTKAGILARSLAKRHICSLNILKRRKNSVLCTVFSTGVIC